MNLKKNWFLFLLFISLVIFGLNFFSNYSLDRLENDFIFVLLFLAVAFLILIFIIKNSTIIKIEKTKVESLISPNITGIYYSKDWREDSDFISYKSFALINSFYKTFDILVEKDQLHLIELPSKHSIWLNLFRGAFYNYLLARANKNIRQTWFDENNKSLVSNEYKKHIFLTIPLPAKNGEISVQNNLIKFNYNGKLLKLQDLAYLNSGHHFYFLISTRNKKIQDFLNIFTTESELVK